MLQEKYKLPALVDSIIEGYQNQNNVEVYPSIEQAEDYLENKRVLFSLKKKKYVDAIYSNLRRQKVIRRIGNSNQWTVNNTDKSQKLEYVGNQQYSFRGKKEIAVKHQNKILRLLKAWGINPAIARFRETPATFIFTIDSSNIKNKDIITEGMLSRSKDKTYINSVIDFLSKKLPQVEVNYVTQKQAKDYYDNLDANQRPDANPEYTGQNTVKNKKVQWKDVRSFYDPVSGRINLIKKKVTDSAAVEELLHPLVMAFRQENPKLYKNLLEEAKKTFPILWEQIKAGYHSDQGFTEQDQNYELVTQALERHFSKQYEEIEQPGKSRKRWDELGMKFMKWFANIIKEWFKYLTGHVYNLRVRDINYNSKLSDIAKTLNATDINFTYDLKTIQPVDKRVKFSLAPKQARALAVYMEGATPAQKDSLLRMFQLSEAHKAMIKNFNASGSAGQGGIMQFDEPTHTYSNLLDPKQNFKSATTAIKGKLKQKHAVKKKETLQDILNLYSVTKEDILDLNDTAANLDKLENSDGSRMRDIYIPDTDWIINRNIGKEFDTLLEEISMFRSWDDIQEDIESGELKFQYLSNTGSLYAAYSALTQKIADTRGMYEDGAAIIIPQVVIANPELGIAGSADIIILKADGSISIKDLKVSRNDYVGDKVKSKRYKNEGYAVGPQSKLWKTGNFRERTKKEKGRNIEYKEDIHQFELTTKQQHSMQLFTYGRMLANNGETVNFNEMETWNIALEGIVGEGKNQKWDGRFSPIRTILHKESENSNLLDRIVPFNQNAILAQQARDMAVQSKTDNIIISDDMVDGFEAPLDNSESSALYDAVFDILDFTKGELISKKDALKRERDRIKLLEGDRDTFDNIASSINLINNVLDEEDFIQEGYQELLEKTATEFEKYIDYIENPNNWGSANYIQKAMAMPKVVKAYEGLVNIKQDSQGKESEVWRLMSSRTKDSILKLIALINKINGTRGANDVTTGITADAIDNYISEIIRKQSIKPELSPLRKEGQEAHTHLWKEYKETENKDKQKFIRGLNGAQSEWLMARINLDKIMKFGVDLGSISANVRSLAVTDDSLVQIMEKIWKAKKQELLDKMNANSIEIGTAAGNLLRVRKRQGLPTDPRSMYKFMLNFDAEGKFKGTYVKKIGPKYEELQEEFRKDLFDETGAWKTYIYYEDKRDLTKEERQYNIDLAKAKQKFADFFRAEVINDDGTIDRGEYHHYDPVFIKERNKHEKLVITGSWKTWRKRDDVTREEWETFREKFFEKKVFYKRLPDDSGDFSGVVVKDKKPFVKTKYRIINERGTNSNIDLVNPKYKSIMESPMDSELKQAERTFYEVYDKFYNHFLEMLPIGVREQMTGRLPMIKDTFYNQLKQSDSITTELWAKLNPASAIKSLLGDTSISKQIYVDENNKMIDSLPIYYVGTPRNDNYVKKINEEIEQITKEFQDGTLKKDGKNLSPQQRLKYFTERKKKLEERRTKIQMTAAAHELSLDLGDSLIRFGTMAQNYETMYEIEHTLKAFQDTISRREYKEPEGNFYTKIGGKVANVFRKKGSAREPRMIQRVKKWMNMVYYDNDKLQRSKMDKITSQLIQKSSLIYVGWNPWGNINNYMVGRLNNFIETVGRGKGHYFNRRAYWRAERLFNERVVPDIFHRLGGRTALNDISGMGRVNKYEQDIPISKYESLVDLFRMMDKKSDIREQAGDVQGRKSWFTRMSEWGFVIQDSMEYNVQTKVGTAVLLSWQVKKKGTTETMSLYDAMEFDRKTGQSTLDKNKWIVIDYRTGEEREWNDQTRYEIRQYIREVNKQIHGNYAHEDRMMAQAHWLGQLAAQFHKWVVPAYDARFRRSYFDENLGWMEGRYITAWSFIEHLFKTAKSIERNSLRKGFFSGKEGQVRLANMWKVAGELGVIVSSWMTRDILTKIWDDESDEKSKIRKRVENLILYQLHRQKTEFVQFVPFFGWYEGYKLFKSPFASSRWIYELGEAMSVSIRTGLALPVAWMRGDEALEKFYANKDYVYQRGTREGKLKIGKEWSDAIPILYAIQRWKAYDTVKNFWVK